MLVKEGSLLTFINNTVVNSTIAAINFDEEERLGVPPGIGSCYRRKHLPEQCGDLERLSNIRSKRRSASSTGRCCRRRISDWGRATWISPSALDWPIRRVTTFHCCPARQRSAPDPMESTWAANVPAWANVSGQPPAVTSATTATLVVNGPGLTHYRFALGYRRVWRGIADRHADFALRFGSGRTFRASDRPKFRRDLSSTPPAPLATQSPSWTVTPGHIDLRINEVLAINTGAVVHEGTLPDVIELYNYGPTAINLAGMTITDDVTDPDKFIFPALTTLASGAVSAALCGRRRRLERHSSGLQPRSKRRDADDFRQRRRRRRYRRSNELRRPIAELFGRDRGNPFVLQAPPRSQAPAWERAGPSTYRRSGAANIRQRTGDPAGLSINEWLAAEDRLFQDDRLELYNRDPLPVPLAGLRLTDNPVGKPDKHAIAALSFVAGSGFATFVPDENSSAGADHLNFNLDAQHELLALLTPQLERMDVVLYMPQTTDVSQGRSPDGGDGYVFINPPNFGFPNSTSFDADVLLDNLRVTEVMFNPAGGQNFEFVELKNISPSVTLDLTGVRFTNGLDFEFPARTLGPNQYIVIAKDLAAFQSRYCGGGACTTINVVGPFGGQLDNTGENLELALREPI